MSLWILHHHDPCAELEKELPNGMYRQGVTETKGVFLMVESRCVLMGHGQMDILEVD